MAWVQLLSWLQQQDTLTIIITIGIVAYLIYRGIIQIPSVKERILKRKQKNVDNPHINCPNYADLQTRFSRILLLRTRIDKMIDVDILKEQMNVVDQTAYDVRKKAEYHFYKLLIKEKPEVKNINNCKEYIAFENIAKIGEKITKDILRFAMKENNIPNNEAEFSQYANKKVDYIINHVAEEFSIRWHDELEITKDRHTEACRGKISKIPSLRNEVADLLFTTLRQCRDIYNSRLDEIERYDKEATTLFPDVYQKVVNDKKRAEAKNL